MQTSKILFISSTSFILGIILSSFLGDIRQYFPLFFILALLVAFSFSIRKNPALLMIIILFFIGLGIFRLEMRSNLASEERDSFQGFVSAEPERREKTTHLVLSGEDEKLLVITERNVEYRYGDILLVEGKIKIPEPFNNFDYPGYLARRGISLIVFNPQIEMVGEKRMLRSYLFDYKEKARSFFERRLPHPHFPIVSAMVLGNQREISKEWQEKLSVTGIGHIISVSGLHVTVMIAIITTLFVGMGHKKFLFVIPAVFLFILITGMQAPAIRAGIMGSCFIFATFLGRMNNSLRIVIITASLMLFINPLLLKHDIGFQLSFLAMLGLIVLSPFFEKKMLFLPQTIRSAVAMSFSAYAFTFPIIIYHFGRASLVFPLTNLLVVPILPIIMISSILFIFLSFFSGALAFLAFIPLWVSISWIIIVVNFFAEFQWSSIMMPPITPTFIILFYLFAALLIYRHLLKKREGEI